MVLCLLWCWGCTVGGCCLCHSTKANRSIEQQRKLNKAGCKVQCVMMMGMVHAGEFALIQKTAPEVFFGSLKSVVDFADLL